MKYPKLKLTGLLLLGALSSVFSQKTFSLQEAVTFGLENNPQAKIADLDIQIAKKKVLETASIGLPQVSGQITYQNFLDVPVQLVPGEAFASPLNPNPPEFIEMQFGVEQQAGMSMTASQLIFNGSYLVGLQASKVYVQLAENQKNLTTTNLKSDITNAYYLVILSQENLSIIKESLAKVTQAFEESKAMNEAGFIDAASVDEVELSKLNLENAVINAENQIKTSKLLLKLYLGLPSSEDLVLTSSLDDLMTQSVILADFNAQNNVQFGMLETQQELQELNLKNQKAEFLPTVSAYYNYQENAYNNEFTFFDSDQSWYPTNLVGVQIAVPIFESGGKVARVAQARIELEKIEEQKTLLETSLQLQYQQALADLTNAQKNLELINKKISLGESILDKALANHKEGLISSFELNQKESQFLQLQAEYLQAAMNVLNAQLEIQKLQTSK